MERRKIKRPDFLTDGLASRRGVNQMIRIKIDTFHDGERWCARAAGHSIFTQGETYDELLANIREAVSLHFEDEIGLGERVDVLVMSEMEISDVA